MIDIFGNEQDTIPSPIKIYIGTTRIRINATKEGILDNGASIKPFIKRVLKEYNYLPNTNILVGEQNYSYHDGLNTAYLPRYCLPELLDYIGTDVDLIQDKPVEPRTIRIGLKNKFKPRDNQKDIIEFMSSNQSYKPVSAQAGFGKACVNSTPIKTPGGWTTHGEVKVGDIVTAWDGTPSKVIGVYPRGKISVFRVTFSDGRWVDAAADHLWTILYRSDSGGEERKSILKSKVLNTLELMNRLSTPTGEERTYIPLCISEKIKHVELPLDPYLLGVLLGDGGFTGSSVSLSTDDFIIQKISNTLPDGVFVSKDAGPKKGTCTYVRLVSQPGKRNNLVRILQDLNLYGKRSWEKSIPKEYLDASHEQRLSLVQGLLDTDGHAGVNGHIEFSSSSKQLAEDVQYLIRSLGGMCFIKIKIPLFMYKGEYRTGRTSYSLRIRFPHPSELFTLPRKRDRLLCNNQYSERLKLRVISVTPLPRKEECTCIAIDHPDKLYVTKDFIVTHNTFCSEATICELKVVTMIVLGGLINQWYKSIKMHTSITSADIYVVQGFDTLKNLWEMVKNRYRPKVVIFSTRTLFLYAIRPKEPYSSLPSYPKLLEILGIGLKIFDEVHLNFYTNTKIDLVSNIRHNIYLSATYQRSSPQGKRIFDTVFPKELRFGSQFFKKYITVHILRYHLGISESEIYKFKRKTGYNHALYEKHLLNRKALFNHFVDKVVIPIIKMYYLNRAEENQHMLILCKTVSFCLKLHEALKNSLETDKSMSVFFAGFKGAEGKETNLKSDIIISTHSSCSTGRDIPGLITCLNTVSFSSEPLIEQVMGRLRKIDDVEVIHVDLWNPEVYSHYHHYRVRAKIYKEKASKVFETTLC